MIINVSGKAYWLPPLPALDWCNALANGFHPDPRHYCARQLNCPTDHPFTWSREQAATFRDELQACYVAAGLLAAPDVD